MRHLNNLRVAAVLLASVGACAEVEHDAPSTAVPSEGNGGAVEEPAGDVHSAPDTQVTAEAAVGLAEGTACLTEFTSEGEVSEPGQKALGSPLLVFLNRNGGTYTRGTTDSSKNTSTIPKVSPVKVPAYEGSEADWQYIVSCVRDQYAAFNVQFTEKDPGTTAHIEAVVGGTPQLLGLADNIGGVSPMACGVISRSVAFVFSQAFSRVRSECEAIAHEIGHSIGLEHEYYCGDQMSYLRECGDREFLDVDAPCGTYGETECKCANPTQNSFEMLLANVGASVPPDAAPSVSLTAPVVNATFARGSLVTVRATASDDHAVREVQLLWQNGTNSTTYTLNSLGGTSYGISLRIPSNGAIGMRILTATAIDDAGQTTSTSPVTIRIN